MGENTDDPDEGEILEEAVRSLIAGIHTSMPARIISYVHGKKPRATVRPVVRFSFMDPDTEERVTQLGERGSKLLPGDVHELVSPQSRRRRKGHGAGPLHRRGLGGPGNRRREVDPGHLGS